MASYHQTPLEEMLVTQVVHPQSANNTTLNGASVDMAGWDGVSFIIMVGATDTTVAMKAQSSSDNATFSDISGASITTYSATDDNQAAILDLWRPGSRYVRPVVTVGAGTSGAVVAVLAVRYRGSGLRPPALGVKELVKVALG